MELLCETSIFAVDPSRASVVMFSLQADNYDLETNMVITAAYYGGSRLLMKFTYSQYECLVMLGLERFRATTAPKKPPSY